MQVDLALHSFEVVSTTERTHLSVRPVSRTSDRDKTAQEIPKKDRNKSIETQNSAGDSIYSAAFSVWCNTQKVLSEGFEAIYDALERRTFAMDIVRSPGSHTHVLCGVCAALHRGSNRGRDVFRFLFIQILADEKSVIQNHTESRKQNRNQSRNRNRNRNQNRNRNRNRNQSFDENVNENVNDDNNRNRKMNNNNNNNHNHNNNDNNNNNDDNNDNDNDDDDDDDNHNHNNNDSDNNNDNINDKESEVLELQDIIDFILTLKSTYLSDNIIQIFPQRDLENFGSKDDYTTHTLFGLKMDNYENHFSQAIIAFSLFKLCRSLIVIILLQKNTRSNIEEFNSTKNRCNLNISDTDNHGIIVNLIMDCIFTDLNAIFNSKFYYTEKNKICESCDEIGKNNNYGDGKKTDNDNGNFSDKHNKNNNSDDNTDNNDNTDNSDSNNDAHGDDNNNNKNNNHEINQKLIDIKSVLNSTFTGIFLPFLSVLHAKKSNYTADKFFLPHCLRFLKFFREIFFCENNEFNNERFHGFELHWVMKEWLEDLMTWVRLTLFLFYQLFLES